MAYNRLQTMRNNIQAISVAFRLGVEKRPPTADEREALGRYAGFGGLKCVLNDANELADAAKWSKSDIELFAPTVELRRLIHDYSKNDKEFSAYMDSLKASVLTAFYTPSPVIDAIADSLKSNGVEVNSFLEPSAGQGAFVDSFLQRYPGAETLAFEKDLLTGKILSALHPSISTEIKGFEKIDPDLKDISMWLHQIFHLEICSCRPSICHEQGDCLPSVNKGYPQLLLLEVIGLGA